MVDRARRDCYTVVHDAACIGWAQVRAFEKVLERKYLKREYFKKRVLEGKCLRECLKKVALKNVA